MKAKKTQRAKKPPPKNEPQGQRFVRKARELGAAGELSLTEAGEKFERAFTAVVPPKRGKG